LLKILSLYKCNHTHVRNAHAWPIRTNTRTTLTTDVVRRERGRGSSKSERDVPLLRQIVLHEALLTSAVVEVECEVTHESHVAVLHADCFVSRGGGRKGSDQKLGFQK
jgi:hypothetical protein